MSGYLGGNDFSGNDHQRGERRLSEWGRNRFEVRCRRHDLRVTSHTECPAAAVLQSARQQSVSVSGTVRIPPYKVGTGDQMIKLYLDLDTAELGPRGELSTIEQLIVCGGNASVTDDYQLLGLIVVRCQ